MVPVQSICHTISGQFLQDYSWFISCQIVVNFPTCFYFITFPSFLSTIGCRLVSLWSFLDIHRTSLTRCELSLDNSSFPSLSIWTGFYRSTSKSARFWPLWTIPIQFVLNSRFFFLSPVGYGGVTSTRLDRVATCAKIIRFALEPRWIQTHIYESFISLKYHNNQSQEATLCVADPQFYATYWIDS